MSDQAALQEVARRRKALRLPAAAHSILAGGLEQLQKDSVHRNWALPPTRIADEVTHYYARHRALGLSSPRPKLRASISEPHAQEQALKVDAGLSFAELGASADPMVKPILLYYACAHLCGVYTRTFFEWDCDNRSHGLSCSYRTDLSQTQISIEASGQFPRLAAACFVLTGQPTPFSPLITYSATPTEHTRPGEPLEHFGKQEIGATLPLRLSLAGVAGFDYGAQLKAVRQRHGFHKFRGLASTAFLVDVLTLFVGSSLARYDVVGWKRILDGRDNSYRIHFEETYERFLCDGVNLILAALQNPQFDFDRKLVPSRDSPYSPSRFEGDPNHQP